MDIPVVDPDPVVVVEPGPVEDPGTSDPVVTDPGEGAGAGGSSSSSGSHIGDYGTGGGAVLDSDGGFAADAQTDKTSLSKRSPLTQSKAQSQGAHLRLVPKSDKTFASYSHNYILDDANKGKDKFPHEHLESAEQLFDAKNLGSELDAGTYTQFSFTSKKVPNPAPDSRVILLGLKLPSFKLVAILGTYKEADGTGAAYLKSSELLSQAIQKDSPFIPKNIAQVSISNPDTQGFIKDAFDDPGVASLLSDSQEGEEDILTLRSGTSNVHEQKWFDTLLGSDNGRAVQEMLNNHPTLYGRKNVISISVWVGDSDGEIDPSMLLTIG